MASTGPGCGPSAKTTGTVIRYAPANTTPPTSAKSTMLNPRLVLVVNDNPVEGASHMQDQNLRRSYPTKLV